MREVSYCEITIERLISLVHSSTDPIRIEVVMGDAWLTCEEAKHMRDFTLTSCLRKYDDTAEVERLMKYYKDVPVWNLTTWIDGSFPTSKGRALYMGIEARCHYKDLREGWLAEQNDIRREKRREYRQRKKAERRDEE